MSHDSNNVATPVVLLAAAVTSVVTAVVVTVTGGRTASKIQLANVPRQYAAPNAAQQSLARLALKVGPNSQTVYVWGGTSTRGFDCSGFTQYVYRHAITNVSIPRTSQSQWASNTGVRVPRQTERVGDLVYFSTYTYAGHVGLYIGNGRYVEYYHSGARARVNTLSEFSRGYLGAHRWYNPASVPSKLVNYVDKLAGKYHVRIINSFTEKGWKRWAIDFVPRSKALYRWAKSQNIKAIQLAHRTRILLKPFPR